jgi:hypothetical protein
VRTSRARRAGLPTSVSALGGAEVELQLVRAFSTVQGDTLVRPNHVDTTASERIQELQR